jgi:signal transduction histidine kinase
MTLLKACNSCAQHASVLSSLHLTARAWDPDTLDPRLCREESEKHGTELARRGVPASCIAAAITLYVESCLPYLLPATDRDRMRWTFALGRWASVYQFHLLSGHSRHEAAERGFLEKKIGQAEQHFQDLSIELADAYEAERRHLARDLHDEIGHDLIVLKLYTQVIALDLKKGDLPQVRRKLRESVSLIKHALLSVRHLTFDLGPAVWNEQGFIPAIRLYASQYAARTGLKVSVRAAKLKTKLPAGYETALYKVLQGALSNIAAHASARSVTITLESRPRYVMMRVEDDGKGFNVGQKLSAPPKSYGLRAMRDRIELLGGSIEFSSHPARKGTGLRGTTIEFRLPIQNEK